MGMECGEDGMQAIRRQDVDWANAAQFTVHCGHSNGASFSTKGEEA